MALIIQSRRLATSKAASAVRLLMSNGLPVGTATGGPSTNTCLLCVSAHSSRSRHTAAASLFAPVYQESTPSPVTAAMSTASSSLSGWIERISIWLAAPKSKVRSRVINVNFHCKRLAHAFPGPSFQNMTCVPISCVAPQPICG